MPFSTQPLATRCAPPAVLLTVFMAGTVQPQPAGPTAGSCFLLLDTKEGTLKRDPADVCTARLPPASTFKIPHALAALESGVIKSADDVIAFDGRPHDYEAWRRDHTLATAMRYSVVWYFQEIAKRLGMDREEFYLRRLRYGNADPSSGLTTFWLGGSLRISPEEQLTFLRRLYYDELPLSERTMQAVREILIQPAGVIVNATGPHSFDAPWPSGTVVSAKTGSTSFGAGRAVRWLVGRVERERRAWIFVSCVTGATDLDAMAAVDLAAAELRANNVL
jgi:beta-lactamase class D